MVPVIAYTFVTGAVIATCVSDPLLNNVHRSTPIRSTHTNSEPIKEYCDALWRNHYSAENIHLGHNNIDRETKLNNPSDRTIIP
jgi:hypothetical protein